MSKLDDIMDEFQAQIQDGYTQPVNGWTTLKQEASKEIKALMLELIGKPTWLDESKNEWTRALIRRVEAL